MINEIINQNTSASNPSTKNETQTKNRIAGTSRRILNDMHKTHPSKNLSRNTRHLMAQIL